MSVNPEHRLQTFHLRSIVRAERKGRGRLKKARVADVTINVGPSEDPEKPKHTEHEDPTVHTSTDQQNQFLPGAVALNSFILMFFLFYLERKDHIKFSSVLTLSYPSFVGCEDNKQCILESVELHLNNTNVTHLFIFILMFMGYLPAHILYLTNDTNRMYYDRFKNIIGIVLFSVLFAIVQGQHNILYQITVALNNVILLSVGMAIQYTKNYTFRYGKWCFFMMTFVCMLVQILPTISAYHNGQELPGFLYVLSFLWACEYLVEVTLHYRPNLSYLHLIVQILLCWTLTFVFWEYGRIDD